VVVVAKVVVGAAALVDVGAAVVVLVVVVVATVVDGRFAEIWDGPLSHDANTTTPSRTTDTAETAERRVLVDRLAPATRVLSGLSTGVALHRRSSRRASG
jgi:hypothetical protein